MVTAEGTRRRSRYRSQVNPLYASLSLSPSLSVPALLFPSVFEYQCRGLEDWISLDGAWVAQTPVRSLRRLEASLARNWRGFRCARCSMICLLLMVLVTWVRISALAHHCIVIASCGRWGRTTVFPFQLLASTSMQALSYSG